MVDRPERSYVRLAAAGSGLAVAGQVVKLLAGLGLLAAVASQLTPDELGLASLALLALTGASALADVGLRDTILVSSSEEQDRGLAGLSVLAALAAAALTVVSAPLVVLLTGDDRALGLILAVAPVAGLQVLTVAREGLYRRALAFKPLILRSTVALGVATAVAVGAAFLGAGPWALLIQPGVEYVVALALLATGPVRGGRPSFRPADLAPAWKVSRPLVGTAAITYAYTNLDDLVVARIAGTPALGRYNLAYRISNSPVYLFTHGTSTVFAPVLRRLVAGSPGRLGAAYVRQVRVIALASGLSLAGLAAFGPELVPRLLGDQWDGIGATLRILCLYGAIRSVGATTGGLFIATGRFGTIRRLSQWSTLAMLALIVPLTEAWGTAGAAAAVTLPLLIATGAALVLTADAASVRRSELLGVVGVQWLLAGAVAGGAALVAAALGLWAGVAAYGVVGAGVAVVAMRDEVAALRRSPLPVDPPVESEDPPPR